MYEIVKTNELEKAKKERGITIISLILTIIILLIVSGVTLNLTLRRKGNI